MKTYKVKQVDAFTSIPFRGNFAGVVPDAQGLTEEQMRLIARENNVSETAFVLPPTVQNADLQIRWFTPTAEVPLCGHATIAAFHVLAHENLAGMKGEGQHLFRLQTKSGILSVRVEKNFYNVVVELEIPKPRFKVLKSIPPPIAAAVGLKKGDVDSRIPVAGHSYLYIPVKKLSALKKLAPNFGALRVACVATKYIGVCLFTFETIETSSSLHSRFFAPAVGINEDPVTGSSNGPLGAYIHEFVLPAGIVPRSRTLPDGRVEYVGEQGDVVDRPGRVKIRVTAGPKGAERIAIAGEAVTVLDASMRL